MTTLCALLGGVPLTLGTGTASEICQTLGYAIVGGLLVSQLLMLFTTPIDCIYMDRVSGWLYDRSRSQSQTSPGGQTRERDLDHSDALLRSVLRRSPNQPRARLPVWVNSASLPQSTLRPLMLKYRPRSCCRGTSRLCHKQSSALAPVERLKLIHIGTSLPRHGGPLPAETGTAGLELGTATNGLWNGEVGSR
jgi:AcrB/AcrD/AcrF family